MVRVGYFNAITEFFFRVLFTIHIVGKPFLGFCSSMWGTYPSVLGLVDGLWFVPVGVFGSSIGSGF